MQGDITQELWRRHARQEAALEQPSLPLQTLGTMSEDELATIRDRTDAATEGPWWHDENDRVWRLHGVMGRTPAQLGGLIPEQIMNKQILKAPKQGTTYMEYWPDGPDADFIVHAREDMPRLLAEISWLRNALEDARNAAISLTMRQNDLRGLYREASQEIFRQRAIIEGLQNSEEDGS